MAQTHLVITDSGLGGLSICAALEQAARAAHASGASGPIRLTYVNAWPEEGRGYNDLPDAATRAGVFDRALARVDALAPDAVLIACNTLSILYELTAHRAAGRVPVEGIIDSGVTLFEEALSAHPGSALVLIGTRTTIESNVHRRRLAARGVDASRLGASSCHGLATSIEHDPHGPATEGLIATCAERAARAAPAGEPLLLGLCCTHYAWVGDALARASAAAAGRPVIPLDPNARLVRDIAPRLLGATPEHHERTRVPGDDAGVPGHDGVRRDQDVSAPAVTVEVISKVTLTEAQRLAVAALVEPVSPATARALRVYNHVPDLF